MIPEDCLDDKGGLFIRSTPPHVCDLPAAKDMEDCVAYRSGCCNTWYEPYTSQYFYTYWRKIGRWRLKRMKKKGVIPEL